MRILLVGKGGRESAMATRIMRSPHTEKLYMAPDAVPGAEATGVSPLDFQGLADVVAANGIDMVVVGNEEAIVAGISDALADTGATVIAPGRECARLEGSKEFAKEFMFRHAIPTARFMTVTSETIDEGNAFLESLTPPYVLKADGLAAGRGVIITESLADAKDTLSDMIEGLFDEASHTVVIEEYLHGREVTVMVAADGQSYRLLPPAKDYKRHGEGSTGPNTGGMGAVSPVAFADQAFLDKVEKRLIQPTLAGLQAEGLSYRGFLYLGIIQVDGEPMLMEYNVRPGEPEAEAVLPRITSDFTGLLRAMSDGTLSTFPLTVSDEACAAVVVTAEGYPGDPRTGDVVNGLDRAASIATVYPGAMTFTDGIPRTSGGRVAVTSALAPTVEEACRLATEAASEISFEGSYFRRDIGTRIEEPN